MFKPHCPNDRETWGERDELNIPQINGKIVIITIIIIFIVK